MAKSKTRTGCGCLLAIVGLIVVVIVIVAVVTGSPKAKPSGGTPKPSHAKYRVSMVTFTKSPPSTVIVGFDVTNIGGETGRPDCLVTVAAPGLLGQGFDHPSKVKPTDVDIVNGFSVKLTEGSAAQVTTNDVLVVCHRHFTETTTTTTTASTPPTTAAVLGGSGPGGCYVDPEGNCYQAGEYCPEHLYGQTVQGDGGTLICEDNDGWRWKVA